MKKEFPIAWMRQRLQRAPVWSRPLIGLAGFVMFMAFTPVILLYLLGNSFYEDFTR